MITRLATSMSPWTYSPNPLARMMSRIVFVALSSLLALVPLVGVAIGGAVVIASVHLGACYLVRLFIKYCFKGIDIPKDIIPHVPNTITIYCTPDQFKEKHMRAKDLPLTIKLPLLVEDETATSLPEGLDTPEMLVKICRFLHFTDFQHLSMASKRSYFICKNNREHLYKPEYFAKYLNFSISEELFKKTAPFDNYMLYFFLCKKICGKAERPRNNDWLSHTHLGSLFPRHLIEQIGPFTFLSIPYVDDFTKAAQHAIERTSIIETPFGGETIHWIKLRFRMKINDQIVVQEIEQIAVLGYGVNWRSMSNTDTNGLWSQGLLLGKQECDFLISLLKNPEGAQINNQYLHLNRKIFPRNRDVPGTTICQIHATLDPPLSNLLQE